MAYAATTNMISAKRLYDQIAACGFTHVLWVPDNVTGELAPFFEAAETPALIRVCREGEAFAMAAGLWIGGMRPLIIVQSTGLFEAGDALRNAFYDLKAPLCLLVGYRGYGAWQADPDHADSARTFLEPVLRAWDLDDVLIADDANLKNLPAVFEPALQGARPCVVVLAEP